METLYVARADLRLLRRAVHVTPYSRFQRINDPMKLEVELSRRAGIVESGLFLEIAQVALIGTDNSVEKFTRPQAGAGTAASITS